MIDQTRAELVTTKDELRSKIAEFNRERQAAESLRRELASAKQEIKNV